MITLLRRIIDRVAIWWNQLRGIEAPEAMPVVEISRTPGLVCPECGTKIQVSIADLLQVGAVVCPSCHLILEVDENKSHGALSALETLANAHAQAQSQASVTLGV